MRYRLLGNSALRVSEAAFGTMTFGDDWGWVPQKTKHGRCTTLSCAEQGRPGRPSESTIQEPKDITAIIPAG